MEDTNMSNELITNKPKFSVAIQSDTYKNLINRTLGDKDRATRFIASISSAVATNQDLQQCDAGTILSGALLGESLNLSPSPQLGQYYLVPFNTKTGRKDESGHDIYTKKAQFQLGYKGYIQLAIRSGQYKKLNVIAVKKGELIRYDALNEEIEVQLIEDEEERENAETIGYYAMFEYTNGFRKAMYWSKSKMEKHALKYSKGYAARKGYTFWEKDFDGMAYKTMLRQLISKWGIMSIDMQQAVEKDMATLNTDGTVEYVDNEEPILTQQDEIEEETPININENVVSMDEL
jgi:recombination protein RecT